MVIWRRSVRILILAAFAISFDSHARTVSKLEVKGVGLTDESDESTIELCKQFKPTRRQIINFFNKAYTVEAYISTTERYSPCYAFGTLEFDDGHFGKWTILSSGAASFVFNRGDGVTLLYKFNKWNDPTACSYGLGDKGEC